LTGLRKISLNDWYSQKSHWSKRKQIKDLYFWVIKSQFKHVFPKDGKYIVSYEFFYRVRPLDASNTIAQVKLVEDIIFEDDRWDIIEKIEISSRKADKDYIRIVVTELN